MLGRTSTLELIAVATAAQFLLAGPARAEIINLSCDNGGMLLVIDTGQRTVIDRNPFQRTKVIAPLKMTVQDFAWREGSGADAADYRMDRATRKVSASAHGTTIPFSNPQCGKSAVLMPKF